MNKFYATIFLIAATSVARAQQKTSGVIYFDQEINTQAMQVTTNGGETAGFHAPDKIVNKFELVFNPTAAKFQKSIVDDATSGAPAGGMVMRIGGAGRDLFFKAGADTVTESFEINGEELLLKTKLGYASANVEKTNETQKIAGFTCKKAIITGAENQKTTLWYTSELNFNASPIVALWTEGVVLGIENNRMKFMATTVNYMKIKDAEVAMPKKGTLITQEEYKKKMDEFRKLIQGGAPGPGGGNIIIRRN